MVKEDQLYTPKEVGLALRISVVTVSRAIRDGKLVAFRVGGQWRIPGSEINNFIGRGTDSALKRDDSPKAVVPSRGDKGSR